jgi:hypothetical protein
MGADEYIGVATPPHVYRHQHGTNTPTDTPTPIPRPRRRSHRPIRPRRRTQPRHEHGDEHPDTVEHADPNRDDCGGHDPLSLGRHHIQQSQHQLRTVEISGTTATFSGPMPDNIGVGDALTYVSGGNRLAFITGRTSSTVYTVSSKDGTIPASALAGTAVGVYRAYNSLDGWESQIENPNIPEPTENDVNPSTNLVSSNTVMMVAAYGDGADTTSLILDSWTTGPTNYIKIYTPSTSNEVGVSQRHNGAWDSAAYRISMDGSYFAPIGIFERYVRIEGLQIDSNLQVVGQSNGVQIDDGNSDAPVEIQVSDSIFRMSGASPATQAYGIGILNGFVGSNANYVAKVWNNLIYGYTAAGGSAGTCMYAQDNGTVYAYNNTCVGGSGAARGIAVFGSVAFYAKNNISIDWADPYSGSFNAASTNNFSDLGDAPGLAA